MLEQDVRVFSTEIDIASRLFLSAGTQYVDYQEPFTQRFYDGYIPRKPWRVLSATDGEKLISPMPPEHYTDSIAIGRIPVEIRQLASRLNINAATPQRYFEPNYTTPNYQRFEQALFKYLELLTIKSEGMEALPIYCGKKNLATTTLDYDTQKFIGLHYDNWDRMAWTQRNYVRNRICINLGIEERYFLFVNLGLNKIFEKLTKLGISEIASDERLYRLFFENYPDYPVTKIKLEPGEYYIAPTENIIHDGCTEDKVYHDVLMTVLGYFHTKGRSV